MLKKKSKKEERKFIPDTTSQQCHKKVLEEMVRSFSSKVNLIEAKRFSKRQPRKLQGEQKKYLVVLATKRALTFGGLGSKKICAPSSMDRALAYEARG